MGEGEEVGNGHILAKLPSLPSQGENASRYAIIRPIRPVEDRKSRIPPITLL